MKNVFLFFFLFFSFFLKAQNENNYVKRPSERMMNASKGTTMVEYNYLTKGYKIQMESGLDMKKGYVLKDIGYHVGDNRTTEIKALYRDTEIAPCAILLVYTNTQWNTKVFYCVPNYYANYTVQQAYTKDILMGDLNLDACKEILLATSQAMGYFARND